MKQLNRALYIVNHPEIYECGKDFMFNEDEFMPAHMYVPVSKEKEKLLKEMVDKVQPRDRYGKTIKHLYYLVSKGNMPEHMQKYKGPSYIDLETGEEVYDKEISK